MKCETCKFRVIYDINLTYFRFIYVMEQQRLLKKIKSVKNVILIKLMFYTRKIEHLFLEGLVPEQDAFYVTHS